MKYSSGNVRDLSLVEQKKLQWAKEKEEMAKLNEFFATTTHQVERTSIRTYYSNVDLTSSSDHLASRKKNYYSRTSDENGINFINDGYYYNQNDERVRSPSLPSIGRTKRRMTPMKAEQQPQQHQQQFNQKLPLQTMEQNTFTQFTTDEDTSGYLSDSRISPDVWNLEVDRGRPRLRLPTETRARTIHAKRITNPDNTPYLSTDHHKKHKHYIEQQLLTHPDPYQSDSTNHSVNGANGKHFSNKKLTTINGGQERTLLSDEVDGNEHESDFSMLNRTPSSSSSECSRQYAKYSNYQGNNEYRKEKEVRAKWNDSNIYEPISKEKNFKSGPCWLEKGLPDSGDESVRSFSFIRGQNAPIDSNTLAERAVRRMKALEFQNAIKEQLAERERIRQLDNEKRLIEERIYEDRIQRQLEAEQERVEEEQRKQLEKLDQERKKQEMMRAAIEKAKNEAEIEKSKKKKENYGNTKDYTHSPRYSLIESSSSQNGSKQADNLNIVSCEQTIDQKPEESNNSTENNDLKQNVDELSNGNKKEYTKTSQFDDDEKILIGSPIKLKKKNVNKLKKSKLENVSSPEISPASSTNKENVPERDIDGIALVLQTLPPLVPIINNDLSNMNQNVNNLNNLQFAVMLAQQLQQINSANSHTVETKPDLKLANNPNIYHETNVQHTSTLRNTQSERNNSYEIRNNREADVIADNICNACGKKQKVKNGGNSEKLTPRSLVSRDRSFTKETRMLQTRDVGTLTSEENVPVITANGLMNTVSTQTETETNEHCCYMHHCSHRVYVKETSTSPINEYDNGSQSDLSLAFKPIHNFKENPPSLLTDELQQSSTSNAGAKATNRLKPIADLKQEIKEIKESIRFEDRPKWGVNRPIAQYVKASDRDPFYLKNKRKKCKKRFSDNVSETNDTTSCNTSESRLSSPNLSKATSGTNLPSNSKVSNEILKRKVCTEILPIKTDKNGLVFLNFSEASVVMSEDEVRQELKNRYAKMERIMNRRRTVDDITRNSEDSGNTKEFEALEN